MTLSEEFKSRNFSKDAREGATEELLTRFATQASTRNG